MNKKEKVLLGVILLLLISPMAGMMLVNSMPNQASILENTPFAPERSFAVAADCAIDTTSTSITNLDDTDNLYGGQYKTYIMVVNTSYAGTGTAIDNITVSFYKASTEYFSFVYDNDTEVVTESVGASYVELGTYSNVTTGNFCNLTINFKVEWAMTDVNDVDLNITAWNGDNSTSSQKDYNLDFDTDLAIASAGAICSTTAIGTGGTINVASLTVYYEDSGGDNYPLAAETDIWLTRTPATGGTDSWQLTLAATTGVTTATTVTAGHIAQIETFTLNAYNQGTTTGDLMGASTTDTVSVSNSGGGGSVPGQSAFGDFLSNPVSLFGIGLICLVGYVMFINPDALKSLGIGKKTRRRSRKTTKRGKR
jgi:hypothetical protein